MTQSAQAAPDNAGCVYIVATPIGNLEDLSSRAEKVLQSVQIVAAEDTRRTQILLNHIGHRAPHLLSLHEHNEAAVVPTLIERVKAGENLALVSDAGTPLVNDPGFGLVNAAFAAGVRIVPIPGACSITALLSACPLPCQPFRYVGFLPAKAGTRSNFLAQQLENAEALVFLEAPHRIRAALTDLAALTERRVFLGRELTKQHEELVVGTAQELLERLPEHPKGEMTLLVEHAQEASATFSERHVVGTLLRELPPAQAARLASQICRVRKSQMYELAMKLAGRDSTERSGK
ncbi:MAG: 16S rRNA (cytidine(1402)-2'-O)-methyltransferase [Pseudomonadota bacterium]